MNLDTQLKLLLFSFMYGLFLSFMININQKYLYSNNTILKIIFTFFFILAHTFLYFIILQKINDGIIHIYSIISIVLGFFIEHYIRKKVVKIKK